MWGYLKHENTVDVKACPAEGGTTCQIRAEGSPTGHLTWVHQIAQNIPLARIAPFQSRWTPGELHGYRASPKRSRRTVTTAAPECDISIACLGIEWSRDTAHSTPSMGRFCRNNAAELKSDELCPRIQLSTAVTN